MNNFAKKAERLLELGGIKRDIILLAISGAAVICSLLNLQPLPFDIAWLAVILCGLPIIAEAVIGLITRFDIKADVLVSLALIASLLIGETFAAGEVAFIMQLGALLEELTVARARAGIERLVHLTPQTARVLKNGSEEIISADQVKAGDIIRVLPGETVPADGIIISGQTSVNQAVMTGESIPADKSEGDTVCSGTVNQFGAFEMKAERAGEDSSIQRMVRLVQSADAGKAKIVGIADRWATLIVAGALSEHPLGKAIVNSYKNEKSAALAKAENFKMLPGRGVAASVGEKQILAGNLQQLSENGVNADDLSAADDYTNRGCTVTYIAVNGKPVGFIALADTLRTESAAAIGALIRLGVTPCCLPAITKMPQNQLPISFLFPM